MRTPKHTPPATSRVPRTPSVFASILALLLLHSPASLAGSAYSYELIARAGIPAPGTDPGTVYGFLGVSPRFLTPTTDNLNFSAELEGPFVDESNDSASMMRLNGEVSLRLRRGEQMPGFDPPRFLDLIRSFLHTDEEGNVTYMATVSPPGFPDGETAFFRLTGGTNELVFRPDLEPSPFQDDAHIANIRADSTHASASGDVVFFTTLEGDDVDLTNNRAVLLYRNDQLSVLAREGDPAPGFPEGTIFGGDALDNTFGQIVDMNSAGAIVFQTTDASPEPGAVPHVIYIEQNGQLAPLVVAGQQAPGTPPSTFWFQISHLKIDESGAYRFHCFLQGDTVDPSNWRSLWRSPGPQSPPQLVARAGEPAPGTPFVHADFVTGATTSNDHGAIGFLGRLADPITKESEGEGNWIAGADQTRLLVRTGDPIPGSETIRFEHPLFPHTNARGDAVFRSTLSFDNEPDGEPVSGFFTADASGEIRVVAIEGETIDVQTTESTEQLAIASLASVSEGSMNNAGKVVFWATLDDGTYAIILATPTASDCPADCDQSGTIDFNDLVAILFAFGPASDLACDPNGTGAVDFNDLVTALFLFGTCD